MKKPTLWERYLTKEIGIEFKACLYFFAFLFYYSCFRVLTHRMDAQIIHMTEMILLAYVIGYVQVYLLWNFDEADSLGKKEWFGMTLCTVFYTVASVFFGWFDKNMAVSIGFGVYVFVMYICTFFVYKCRREIDDKILNYSLELFKTRNKNE